MPIRPIELPEITEFCDLLCTVEYPYYEQLREAMLLLDHTGCRILEIFEIDRWSVVDGYNVAVQPQKGNNLRYIALNETFDSFLYSIISQTSPFVGCTTSMLYNLYNRIKVWNYFLNGDKFITFYIFRYRYIKQLAADGMSITDIAAHMGYTNTSTPSAYLSSNLDLDYYIPPIPVVEVGGQIWMANNLAVDDGNGGIFHANNDAANDSGYGLLYTYSAALRVADTVAGFHLPSFDDFIVLRNFIGSDAGKLKAIDYYYWLYPNISAVDFYAFSARGSGMILTTNNSVYAFKQRCYFISNLYVAPNGFYAFTCRYNSANFGSNVTNTAYAATVRLIAD